MANWSIVVLTTRLSSVCVSSFVYRFGTFVSSVSVSFVYRFRTCLIVFLGSCCLDVNFGVIHTVKVYRVNGIVGECSVMMWSRA